MLQVNSEILILTSGIILIVSTALFGLLIPRLNSKIYKLQLRINNIAFTKDIIIRKLEMDDLRTNRVITLQDDKIIFSKLNVSKKTNEELEYLFRHELSSLIKTINTKYCKENKNQIKEMSTIKFNELHKKLMYDLIQKYNHLNEKEKKINNNISSLVKKRDNWNVKIVITQLIGLFMGILSSFIGKVI